MAGSGDFGREREPSYRRLEVWQAAMDLAEDVCRLTRGFPSEERFGLARQLSSAAVSVPSNIAEGYGRRHRREYLHHLSIARGSLMEAETQLTLAVRLGYLNRDDVLQAWDTAQRTGKMLHRLIQSLSDDAP